MVDLCSWEGGRRRGLVQREQWRAQEGRAKVQVNSVAFGELALLSLAHISSDGDTQRQNMSLVR